MTTEASARTLRRTGRELSVVIGAALGLMLLIGAAIQSALVQTGPLKSLTASLRSETLHETSEVSASMAAANYPNCRFGVGGAISGYAVSTLNIGWYMDWSASANPARPNGAEYIQLVGLKPGPGIGYIYTPPISTVYSIADQNPGAVWLIGNEPDSPWQDKLLPETYARAYHDLYALIKQHDASAQIGAGSIVQPTPLRFQYLDRVLSTYQQLYGESLPADLWSIHSYILREVDPSDPGVLSGTVEMWGAYIPPGIAVTRGELYTYSQMFDVAIFRQRLLDFRVWMRDQGYRDVPLYITEFGTLFQYPPYIPGDPTVDEFGVPMDEARTAKFMTSTFNVLLNLSDAAIGYPADANRLVQRWLWYSTDDAYHYGGALFDPASHARRPLGDVYASYTQAITPNVDLLAVQVVAEPAASWYEGVPVTAALKAQISNIGNISITQPITIAFYAGQPPSGTLLESKVITSGLAGCAATREVSITWPNLSAGAHPVYVQIDPDNVIGEANESNNIATGMVLVATQRVYLPLVFKNQPWTP